VKCPVCHRLRLEYERRMLVLVNARESQAILEEYSGKPSQILRADVVLEEKAVKRAEEELNAHRASHKAIAAG